MPTRPNPHTWQQSLIFWLVGKLASLVVRMLMCTVRSVGERPRCRPPLPDGHRNGVYAMWHHSQVYCVYSHRNQGIGILISQHRDGEYVARVAAEMGFRPVRGSSTRGGARAMMEMRQRARKGDDIAITTDGPRGPRHVVQRGAVFLAQATGLPLIPAIIGGSAYWEAPSWDRFRIPKPFSRAKLQFGEPIVVPQGLSIRELEPYREQLQSAMRELQDQLDAELQGPKGRRSHEGP